MRTFASSLITIAALLVTGSCAQGKDKASAPAYAVLDASGAQLREDFNRAKGSVRVLFVIDPICPGCLRGLDDMNRSLLAKTNDPRLQAFVVHVPVLSAGAKAKDVPRAAELLTNAHVRHYWNPSGAFGRQLTEAVGLKRGEEPVYAWDVWLIYGPEASWDDSLPPRPVRLMHQLRALEGSTEFPRLDSDAFAQEVQQLLAKLR
jgi:hypothetical protein